MSESEARWYPAKRKPAENGASALPPPNVVKFAPVYMMQPRPDGLARAPEHPIGLRQFRIDHELAYADLEAEVTRVRTFTIDLVDGLLQTPEYAAAVIRTNQPLAGEEYVRQRVESWTRRNAHLRDPKPIHLEAIIAEGALHLRVGGREVMRRQLAHLLDLANMSNVDIRVVPAGRAYPAMGTPFRVLSFRGRPDIGYIELLDMGLYIEEPDDLELYVVRFAGLRDVALDPEQTRRLITAIESELD